MEVLEVLEVILSFFKNLILKKFTFFWPRQNIAKKRFQNAKKWGQKCANMSGCLVFYHIKACIFHFLTLNIFRGFFKCTQPYVGFFYNFLFKFIVLVISKTSLYSVFTSIFRANTWQTLLKLCLIISWNIFFLLNVKH